MHIEASCCKNAGALLVETSPSQPERELGGGASTRSRDRVETRPALGRSRKTIKGKCARLQQSVVCRYGGMGWRSQPSEGFTGGSIRRKELAISQGGCARKVRAVETASKRTGGASYSDDSSHRLRLRLPPETKQTAILAGIVEKQGSQDTPGVITETILQSSSRDNRPRIKRAHLHGTGGVAARWVSIIEADTHDGRVNIVRAMYV
ncbi:hypothetical protein BV20DRAFT_739336 [Pilatotrama ljubarskyi]|nr:hypothetical protein BV20DRAFT_739336 [Pilatotrama ljubarskyi]